MRISLYETAWDNVPKPRDVTWADLVDLLSKHRVTTCAPCVGHRCEEKKKAGGWHPVEMDGVRSKAAARSIHAAVFDLDDVTEEEIDAAIAKLAGYAFVCHSTHAHRPGGMALRLVLPVSRPIAPAEFDAFWYAAVKHLGIRADLGAQSYAQMFFLPSHSGEHDASFDVQEGRPLDVDALVSAGRNGVRLGPGVPLAPSLPAAEIQSEHVAVASLRDMAERLKRGASAKNRALISRALAGKPLSPPRSGSYGGQDSELLVLMSTAAFCLPKGTDEAAVAHLFAPCFAQTDWAEGLEHLTSEALKKFRLALERRQERDEIQAARHRTILAKLGFRPTDARREVPALDEPQAEDAADPEEWREQLITTSGRKVGEAEQDEDGKQMKLLVCEENIALVLTHAPEWRGALRFNDASREIEVKGAPVEQTSLESLDVEIARWFQRSAWMRIGLCPKPAMIRDVIVPVARATTVDPVRDYLEGLVWDGEHRADTFLERYFGADATDDDVLDHVRAVSRRWLVSFVARGLNPGCKVDTVLILEGAQGMKKSTGLEVLAASGFCDAPITMRDKDSAALAGKYWLVELGELNALRNAADAEELKQFISRRDDTYRPPYGKTTIKVPRRCVFVGSTNSTEYLRKDPTGYRRYWPVRCGVVQKDALQRDRDQLLAEAVALYKQGEQWWLTDEEAKTAEVQAEDRAEVDGDVFVDAIADWFAGLAPDKRPRDVSLAEVLTGALDLSTEAINRHEKAGGRALRALGFKHIARRVGGGRSVRRWITPEHILASESDATATAPRPALGKLLPMK